ncbi:hypothetical protein LCGC14_0130900 [marine sediment metagenome]|uniref:Uncharacterized protein n=1 Tax=marine sediment metagenome TaxID=412755 RepID=A0A0F9Y5Q9_9ZZZZ
MDHRNPITECHKPVSPTVSVLWLLLPMGYTGALSFSISSRHGLDKITNSWRVGLAGTQFLAARAERQVAFCGVVSTPR